MKLSSAQVKVIRRILAHPTDDFGELLALAELDPGLDFRDANLRGVRFGAIDLAPFDFTGADLEGSYWGQATGKPKFTARDPRPELQAELALLVAKSLRHGLTRPAEELVQALEQAGGVIRRDDFQDQLKSISQHDRRSLRALGIRIAAYCVYVAPVVASGQARAVDLHLTGNTPWSPSLTVPTRLSWGVPAPREFAYRGLLHIGAFAVPLEPLERLSELMRASPGSSAHKILSEQALSELGWGVQETVKILRTLGYARLTVSPEGIVGPFHRRVEQKKTVRRASPFDVLSKLVDPSPLAPGKKKRRRRRRVRESKDTT